MILAARYVLPISGPVIEDGAVLVRGDSIVEVGSLAQMRDRHPGQEVRDFGSAALLPGFVDVHTHLEYSVFRGLLNDLPYTQWKLQLLRKERLLGADDWEVSARLGALEAIRSGITTIADMSDSGASVRAAEEAGLRGIVYREVSTMRKDQVESVLSAARTDIEEWSASCAGGRISVGIAPHSPYSCHPALFRAAAALAIEEGLPVSTHLAGSRDEYDFVKYGSTSFAVDFSDPTSWREAGWLPTGVSPVEYLERWGFFEAPRVLAVHCVHVDDADIEILAARGVAVAFCARCNAKLAMGVAPLGGFARRGLVVGIGTDSPASNATMDFFDEMRVGLILQRAVSGDDGFLTAERFIRMATLDGARAIGLEEAVGTIEPGKKADLISVDLSHSHQVPIQDPYAALLHTTNQDSVLMTMVDGRILFDDHSWETLDRDAIFSAAEPTRVKLQG